MNVLSYTSLNSFLCKEKLNITPGYTCFSNKMIKKLYKLEKELNVNNITINPITLDYESLPSDGSEDSKIINNLAGILDCSSEYCLLKKKRVKEILTDDELKKEKNRFKVKGPRNLNIGTDGELHAYKVLLQWAEVFDFFHPLPHTIISNKQISKDKLKPSLFLNAINDFYPKIKVIATDISIEVKDLSWHAVVLLIDLREDTWTIEYFDSIGLPPNENVTEIMEEMGKELRKKNKKTEIVIVSGKVKHQTTTTECGLHSLIYIRKRIEGTSYSAFSRFKIPDSFAKEFRRCVFVS